MTDSFEKAKVKLVTVVASFQFGDRICDDLKALGVSGYTRSKVDGWGVHGARKAGFIDGANVRLETLVGAELADKVLRMIATNFTGDAVVAFAVDAEAVPSSHFGPAERW